MAWIFGLSAQCSNPEEARAFADHFADFTATMNDGTPVDAEVGIQAGTCCWVCPSNVSRSGVTDRRVADQLTEVGNALYEHLRQAPPFRIALVGVGVDDVRSDDEVVKIINDPHPGWNGLVVSTALWDRAGRPPGFVPFRTGSVWRPYLGEVAPGEGE